MKRFLISILALLCIAGESFAQIPELKPLKDLEDVLNPAEKKGKWGYANNSGKMIIKAVFDAADPFETVVSADGTIMEVARIKANGSWGYITRENVYLIEPVYDTVTHFDRFATVVAKSGPYNALIGVRSTTSSRLNIPVLASNILQLNLSEIGEFMDNGLALAYKAGKCGMLDYKGNWAIPCRYDSIDLNRFGGYDVIFEGKCGVLNADGAILVEPQYDAIAWEPSFNAFVVQKDGGMGLVDADGNRIAPPVYLSIEPLGDSAFIVRKNERLGLLGRDGRILLQSYYDSIALCTSGYFVSKDGENGVVAQGDEVILPFGYWTADPSVILSSGYDLVEWNAEAEMFIVYKGGKKGALWKDGSFALDTVYDSIEYEPYGWLLGIDGMHEALDKELNYLVGRGPWTADLAALLDKYERVAWDASTGFTVMDGGKMGLVAHDGRLILPAVYDDFNVNLEAGIIEANMGGVVITFDLEGNPIPVPEVKPEEAAASIPEENMTEEKTKPIE